MFTDYLVLKSAVPQKYASEIERRLFFVSDDIIDFRLIEHADGIAAIEVVTAQQVETHTLADKIHTLIDTEILRQRSDPHQSHLALRTATPVSHRDVRAPPGAWHRF